MAINGAREGLRLPSSLNADQMSSEGIAISALQAVRGVMASTFNDLASDETWPPATNGATPARTLRRKRNRGVEGQT